MYHFEFDMMWYTESKILIPLNTRDVRYEIFPMSWEFMSRYHDIN